MGGYGSGNWYRGSSKSTEENFHSFRMSRLREEGVVKEGVYKSGSWQWRRNEEVVSALGYEVNMINPADRWIRVHYKNTRTQESYDYKIHLTSTSPNYGGKRWWFKCPGKNCGKRVIVLYLATVLVCRHCWGMAYSSQNQSYADRQTDKAFRLAYILGLRGNVLDGFYGQKPKGMHWKTYHRKMAEIEVATQASLRGVMARFEEFL